LERIIAIKEDEDAYSNSTSNDDTAGDMDYQLTHEIGGGAVEGGDAFLPLNESAVMMPTDDAVGHDRFSSLGGEQSVFGGAVPMAQHRLKLPGRERQRRWRRREHLTTAREEMEEPRTLFVGSSSSSSSSSSSASSFPFSSPPSSSSSSSAAVVVTPPANPTIWNANTHLDLMMAVRYYRYLIALFILSSLARTDLESETVSQTRQGSVQEDIVEPGPHQPDEPQDAATQLPLLHRRGTARAQLAVAVGLRDDQHRYVHCHALFRLLDSLSHECASMSQRASVLAISMWLRSSSTRCDCTSGLAGCCR
jgi:hypothetical protein